MTLHEKLMQLPRDRHVYYFRRRRPGGRWVWTARFRDGAGKRQIELGPSLPNGCPDVPCRHTIVRWVMPTTRAEQEALREAGRWANAQRRVRSNQYRKQREQKAVI